MPPSREKNIVVEKADFRRERAARKRGLWPMAGIDEVGRGPLAGPVAAAAVILDPKNLPDGIADSKALDAATREALFEEIMKRALAVSVGMASAQEIDSINIRQATFLAMRRAAVGLALRPAFLLIDGNDLPHDMPCTGETLVKGDALCLSIAAASIIAKVARDRLMIRLASRHPGYGFETHMGYATQAHREAVQRLGPCPFHRRSFGIVKEYSSL